MPQINFPTEFIEIVRALLPDEQSVQLFVESCQQPLRRSIRLNPLKPAVTTEQLESSIGKLASIPWHPDGYWLKQEPDMPLGNLASHLLGQFYIQEASSMLPPVAMEYVAKQLSVKLDKVLDMAAAPGSKTTQLAALMNNQGMLLANEFSASRLKVLAANILRCGVVNSALTHFDASVLGSTLPNQFDAVLLDAPCSGEGTIRKDPNAFANWDLESVHEIAHLQKQLIESAFHALKKDGILIYSTCTLNPYENQQVCEHLLTRFEGGVKSIPLNQLFSNAEQVATPEGYLHVWPQTFDSEGFFIAAFAKTSVSECTAKKIKRKVNQAYQAVRGKEKQQFVERLSSLGFRLPEEHCLYLKEQTLWLLPEVFIPYLEQIRFNRIGCKLADIHKKNLRLHHDFAVNYPDCFTGSRCKLNQLQAEQYLQGKDIRDLKDLPAKGDVLVTYQQHVLGLGKSVSGRLKNNLPREIVRDQPIMNI